jgi:nicotinate-nucleotide pyrophosphorylase (carboxylating)
MGPLPTLPPLPPEETWLPLVELALAEDIGPGDVTSRLVADPSQDATAVLEARQELVVCGLEVAGAIFGQLDPDVDFRTRAREGEVVSAGAELAEIRGNLLALLAAERTALNFLMRLSGVATSTRRYVDAVAGTGAAIVDTRKTLPGWRSLDKYAAAVGGATNHRFGLFDGVLLKDNHVAMAGGVALAVKSALENAPRGLRVQVEVESSEDADAAVAAGADFLLLDNCSPDTMRAIVTRLGDRAVLEASGGVTLANVREVAETGVHRISIGAITHSAPGVDVAMEMRGGGARG